MSGMASRHDRSMADALPSDGRRCCPMVTCSLRVAGYAVRPARSGSRTARSGIIPHKR